ncbi:leucine--tRNA ligase [Candidatus Woesearchaeota archaeon]|nr:leucine--tRNA ligase [Candidatus Woesearchaeota archaeon]
MVDFNKISKKWQGRWRKAQIFKSEIKKDKPKMTVIEMYPYPSASYLHMGHVRNYVMGDVFARFKRMNGFNVLYPMGYDSFGLPAETAAKKEGVHPKKYADHAIEKIMEYQKALGNSYDWDRVLWSHDPDYYKWNQLFFVRMFEKGLAYRRKAPVNWCEECQSVLANEEAEKGTCWRCESPVTKKDLDQWFLKITAYAEKLIKDLNKIEWPEKIKIMQENWVGKSKGTLLEFPIKDSDKKLSVFTTRPDTFFGITFLVYAPEHPDVLELVKETKYENDVKKFIKKVSEEDFITRIAVNKEKEGMFIGRHAVNPVTKEEIPIYIANFVLYEYGTGAIIAVPAHDQRDFEFAKKYKIPIKVVINPQMFDLDPEKMTRAYMGDGNMVNSAQFNGMNNRDAIPEFNKFFEKHGCARVTVQYKIRDWLISRQRYWGTPIPIVHCDKCGVVSVPKKDLPVLLPEKVDFNSKINPLLSNSEFLNVKCPECGGNAKRETDTMGGFVDSSWYFLRYCDNKNKKKAFDKKKVNYWMPVDQYIGGAEHAVMHLIYARFYVKALKDLGFVDFDEPFMRLFNQGVVHKGGVRMSKSKGNVVFQTDISDRYGIDTARFFLMFVASPDKDMEWDDKAVEGAYKFLVKVHYLINTHKIVDKVIKNQESKAHKAILEVTDYISSFKYNLALISIMQLANYLYTKEEVSRFAVKNLLLLLSPFAPHLAEELWEKLGYKGFISLERWAKGDKKKIDMKVEASEDLYQGIRKDILALQDLTGLTKPNKIMLIIPNTWKYAFIKNFKKEIEKTRDVGKLIKALCAKDKTNKKFIANFVPKFVKNIDKIPEFILSQTDEKKALNEFVAELEKEFKTKFEIVVEKDSKEQKAVQAMPGKPAIVFA